MAETDQVCLRFWVDLVVANESMVRGLIEEGGWDSESRGMCMGERCREHRHCARSLGQYTLSKACSARDTGGKLTALVISAGATQEIFPVECQQYDTG